MEQIPQQNRVEALILEGLESGELIEATDTWWEQKRDRLITKISQTGLPKPLSEITPQLNAQHPKN
jgi:uncharacterized membrane protein